MNGIEFYDFLRNNYNQNGQPLYGNFTLKQTGRQNLKLRSLRYTALRCRRRVAVVQ